MVGWIVAAVILAVSGWVTMQTSDGSAGYRIGRFVGTVAAALILATIARWIFVRVRYGRAGKEVMRSGWVPLGAALMATLVTAGTIGSLAPVDPASALRIAPSYELVEAAPEIVAQFERTVEQDAYRSVIVREVRQDGESVGWLAAGDGGLRGDDWEEVVRGFDNGSGSVSTREIVAGQPVAVAERAGGTLAIWLEPPLMLTVIAADSDSARTLVEAVLTAP